MSLQEAGPPLDTLKEQLPMEQPLQDDKVTVNGEGYEGDVGMGGGDDQYHVSDQIDKSTDADNNIRVRKLTERGREHQLSQRERDFGAAVSRWRAEALSAQTSLTSGANVEQLNALASKLEESMSKIQSVFGDISQLGNGVIEKKFIDKMDDTEERNFNLRSELSAAIRDIQMETQSRRSQGSVHSRMSGKSRGSRESVQSHISRASKVSSKAAAAADVAALQTELMFADVEAEQRAALAEQRAALDTQRAALDKLKARKKLEVAVARLKVLESDEEGTLNTRDMAVDLASHTNSVVEVPRIVPVALPPSTEFLKLSSCNEKVVSTTHKDPVVLNPCTKEFVPRNHVSNAEKMIMYNNDEGISSMLRELAAEISLSRLARPDPGIFTGDAIAYPVWKAGFDQLIGNRVKSSEEKIYHLRNYLGGEALEAVEGFLYLSSSDAYDSARELLDKRYGNSFSVSRAFRDKLEKWPKVNNHDGGGLRRLSDFLRQCKLAMSTNSSLNVLNDERENARILEKLPDWLIKRWSRIIVDSRDNKGVFPSFARFAEFIANEAEIACEPVTANLASESSKLSSHEKAPNWSDKTSNHKRVAGAFSTGTEEVTTPIPVCPLCDSASHELKTCSQWEGKSMAEKHQLIRSKGVCYGCLVPGHMNKDCTNRLKCNKCGKTHPTCLHREAEEKFEHQMNCKATHVMEEPLATNVAATKCAAETSGRTSMIVPVTLYHQDQPDKTVVTYAMLDTQSDTTFILDELLEKLGAPRTAANLRLSTLSAKDELIASSCVQGLVIQGIKQDAKVQLPTTYSQRLMPVDRSHIPCPAIAQRLPYLSRISTHLSDLLDVPVGLIIGYDCPKALLPREVIPSEGDGPFALRTDLGWSLVGRYEHGSEGDSIIRNNKKLEKIGSPCSSHIVADIKVKEDYVEKLPEVKSEDHEVKAITYCVRTRKIDRDTQSKLQHCSNRREVGKYIVSQKIDREQVTLMKSVGRVQRHSALAKLNPEGRKRVGGRLKKRSLSYEQVHPMITPRNLSIPKRRDRLLQQRQEKWQHLGHCLKIEDDKIYRGQWRRGHVVEIYPSSDGLVGKVKVMVGDVMVGDATLDEKGKRRKTASYLDRISHKLVLLVEATDD